MGRNRTTGTLIDHGPYRVPPTSVLIAFESAARHGNFSQAARELHTSQSAISRHIASLEKHLSERLFDRSRIGVSLTDAGQRYHEAVLIGLGALRDGAAEVAALSGTGPPEVTVACPDEASQLFMMQRFDALWAALGEDVRVRILPGADALAPPPSGPSADMILTWEAQGGAPRHRVVVATEAIGVFCSPGYAAAHADVLNGPVADWGGLTFLALPDCEEGGPSWERWFEVAGRPAAAPRYAVAASHAHALEEAVAGRGLVLGWRHLIGRHVEAGTLVMQGGAFVATGRCLHAVLTAKGRDQPPVRACMAFLAVASRQRAGGWDEP